jgi:hypothetical protein
MEIEIWPVELLSRTIWKPATAKQVPQVAAAPFWTMNRVRQPDCHAKEALGV